MTSVMTLIGVVIPRSGSVSVLLGERKVVGIRKSYNSYSCGENNSRKAWSGGKLTIPRSMKRGRSYAFACRGILARWRGREAFLVGVYEA